MSLIEFPPGTRPRDSCGCLIGAVFLLGTLLFIMASMKP